jgi:D-sedoheptulose 7-phosphate isomerase
MKDSADFITRRFAESAAAFQNAANQLGTVIQGAADLTVSALRAGGKILICGNGGSAADSQHFAAEFVCRLSADFNRPPIPAIALTTDTSYLTAHMNDFGVEEIFARQIEALGQPEDILIAISTSGNSPNILAAVKAAKAKGMKVIGVTGTVGKLRDQVDLAICAPTDKGQIMQEIHLCVYHCICHIVERTIN